VLNFPANPTTQCVDLDFFEKVIAVAKEHGIWVVHDLAYADIVFDGYRAPSILQVPGAKEVAVEFFTLSKSYNMPGWRIGFMCGNRKLVAALSRLKSYFDYGMFTPIQIAAILALEGPQDCLEEIRQTYQNRRDVLCNGLFAAGWRVEKPKATMFVWARIPEAYRAMGYLPVAMRNYLVRLGWSHGDQEIFSTEEMIAAFDLPQIGRSPARFDFAKLENLNGHYIRASADADLLAAIDGLLPHIANGEEIRLKLTPAVRGQVLAAMPELKERAKTLIELVDAASFIWAARPLALDDKAKALLTAEARTLLAEAIGALEAVEPWTAEATEQAVRGLAERVGAKLGAIAQPLRAALTGRTTSPGIFNVLAVLGRQESLARLRDQAGGG